MNFRLVFRNNLALEFNRLLYIDRSFVIVNKPSGFVTQYPGDGQTEAVAELVGPIPSVPSTTNVFPVHRLDKGTTGCLIFARSPNHAHTLSRQLQQRTVHKTYHVLINTSSNPALTKEDSGCVRVGMSLKNGRPHISQSKSARETWTDWQVVGSSSQSDVALVKLRLYTGMKHQLRVHMSDILKAPILGDLQHAGTQTSTPRSLSIPNDRLFLHASEVSFHRFKRTGKRLNLTIRAPLPSDFMELCTRIGIEVPSYLEEGGLFIDGQPMREVPDLDGHWLHSS
ncbi:pseudouridine synthase [Lentinula aciculospora]|uniref:21S rRNA pseudouridine(2819) synthase n=1 Tax=Lentinula aciculospora TaxID=153920 RepID=A0A9W9DQ47_9AGAR|nr:pseudouridine synthase [Lentinula aciculospora]